MFRNRRALASGLLVLLGGPGCGSDRVRSEPERAVPDAGSGTLPPAPPGPPPEGREFCARNRADAVRDVFCQTEPATIRDLRDLEDRLGLVPHLPDAGGSAGQYGVVGYGVPSSLVLLGHSTALSGRFVSPINPRAILLGVNMFLAFSRGVQQVEIAVHDRHDYALNLYLVTFEQACNGAPGGCVPGDLYTPRIESSWTRVGIQDDEDLKNTPSDCRQCHQRGTDAPILLMRELDGPWTHFFMPADAEPFDFPEATGVDLMHDYILAKGEETYAGVPSGALRETVGIMLENSVDGQQPIVFDGSAILNERWPWSPNGYQPAAVRSATWQRDYDAFKRGELLALPFYAPRATDPAKQAKLSAAYQRYLAGELPAEALPDLGDIFPDDPQVQAEIGLRVEPGTAPADALVQACGTCHNDVLDQNVSRARFNIDLSRMGRPEVDVAIARLSAAPGAPGTMPPTGRRQLDPESRERLIEYLKGDVRTPAEDALLASAARLGMAGNQPHIIESPPPAKY